MNGAVGRVLQEDVLAPWPGAAEHVAGADLEVEERRPPTDSAAVVRRGAAATSVERGAVELVVEVRRAVLEHGDRERELLGRLDVVRLVDRAVLDGVVRGLGAAGTGRCTPSTRPPLTRYSVRVTPSAVAVGRGERHGDRAWSPFGFGRVRRRPWSSAASSSACGDHVDVDLLRVRLAVVVGDGQRRRVAPGARRTCASGSPRSSRRCRRRSPTRTRCRPSRRSRSARGCRRSGTRAGSRPACPAPPM